MSSIQKKPFIEKVIATLTEEQKTTLVGLINGSDLTPEFRSLVNRTYKVTASDKGVNHVILETESGKHTGYLVYTDDYCVFIGYKDIQELTMLNIDVTHQTCEKVDEALTITELRFELSGGGSIGEDVTADEINSGSATLGQVLTANGSGGASWETLAGALEVSNITALTDEQINGLKAGDIVVKVTGNQKHSYRVSYKENGTGICLTYTDASVSETVSYDYTDSHWVYNSTDVTHLGIPTVTIALSQVVSADPLQVQLTDEQYNVFANNKQVIIDITELHPTSSVVIWSHAEKDEYSIVFGYSDGASLGVVKYSISIDITYKIATYRPQDKEIAPSQVATNSSIDEGKLLAMDSYGEGILTRNLPILTTAPSQDNTEGGIIIVVLSSDVGITKYNGYLYVITGA